MEYILLIADIHANANAFRAVMNDARIRYLDHDLKIWFLGDLVGRGPDPIKCWRLLQQYAPEVVVFGNHDGGLINYYSDVKFSEKWYGLFKGQEWEILLQHRKKFEHTNLLISDENGEPQGGAVLEKIREWPVVWVPRPGIYLVHGGLERPLSELDDPLSDLFSELVWGYVDRPLHAQYTVEAFQWLYQNGVDQSEIRVTADILQPPRLVLVGHYHRRTFYHSSNKDSWGEKIEIDQQYALNKAMQSPILISPGSVGFPREEDGDMDASYAVLCLQKQQPHSIIFHKVAYDNQNVSEVT